MTAVVAAHNLNGLNNRNLFSHSSGCLKSKIECGHAYTPSRSSRGEDVLWLFQLLVTDIFPCLAAVPCHSLSLWSHRCLLFGLSNVPVTHSYKNSHHWIYSPPKTTQENLLISKFFNLITPAKTLFPNTITFIGSGN